MPTDQQKVSAIILAGGQAQRMGGADKGLLLFRGKPLIAQVLARVKPQVEEVFISANRNTEAYAQLGYPVLSDAIEGFAGPLAGLHRALREAAHPFILCVPCDTPFLPADLVARLREALIKSESDIAVPVAGGQIHHAVMLFRRGLASSLEDFLAANERKVGKWQAGHKQVIVPFEQADAFLNINTPEELLHAEEMAGN